MAADYTFTIGTGCTVSPEERDGVGPEKTIEFKNQSGGTVILRYPQGGNPFSDVADMASEVLLNGISTEHIVRENVADKGVYDILVFCGVTDASPRIRIITSVAS